MKPEIKYEIKLHEEEIHPEEQFASEDAAADRKLVLEIWRDYESGNLWAWCCVEVRATIEVEDEVFIGRVTLGCCSYKSEEDFKTPGGYYEQMCAEARDDLAGSIHEAARRGGIAEGIVYDLKLHSK